MRRPEVDCIYTYERFLDSNRFQPSFASSLAGLSRILGEGSDKEGIRFRQSSMKVRAGQEREHRMGDEDGQFTGDVDQRLEGLGHKECHCPIHGHSCRARDTPVGGGEEFKGDEHCQGTPATLVGEEEEYECSQGRNWCRIGELRDKPHENCASTHHTRRRSGKKREGRKGSVLVGAS